MTTIAHMVSASYIAVRVANVAPTELDYIVLSLVSAGVVDLDHIYLIIRDRKFYRKEGYSKHLHKARSSFHELFGFFMLGLLMLVVSFFDQKLALVLGLPAMLHLIQDMLAGISIPFGPIDKTEISLVRQNIKIKVILDVTVLFIFGILWIKYLNAVI
jgi:hypothetical protein